MSFTAGIILSVFVVSICCSASYAAASIDPASLQALPSEIKAGSRANFRLTTARQDDVREAYVTYRGPGVWFSQTYPLTKKTVKKKEIQWEFTTQQRFNSTGEVIYSLRLSKGERDRTFGCFSPPLGEMQEGVYKFCHP